MKQFYLLPLWTSSNPRGRLRGFDVNPLDMNPNTLSSRMKKLGIQRRATKCGEPTNLRGAILDPGPHLPWVTATLTRL